MSARERGTGLAAGRRRNERGIALLLVLWLLVLLSILALSFTGTARTQARIARNLYDNAQARWMADAGVRLAVRRLRLEDGERPATDGRVWFCRFQAGSIAASVQDATGLIDLNAASEEDLEKLFAAAGMEEARARRLAAAVADFRDADGERRPDGAEADDYVSAGLAHGPRNGPFQAVAELEQVSGMPPALLDRIRGALTVHNRNPRANLRLAPPLVRAALGEAPGADATIAVRRRGIFHITVTAKTASGGYFVRNAVLRMNGRSSQGYEVLRWEQAGAREWTLPDPQDLPPC